MYQNVKEFCTLCTRSDNSKYRVINPFPFPYFIQMHLLMSLNVPKTQFSSAWRVSAKDKLIENITISCNNATETVDKTDIDTNYRLWWLSADVNDAIEVKSVHKTHKISSAVWFEDCFCWKEPFQPDLHSLLTYLWKTTSCSNRLSLRTSHHILTSVGFSHTS